MWVVALVSGLLAQPTPVLAGGSARIVVLGVARDVPRGGLIQSLRIQLSGERAVRIGGSLARAPLGEQVRAAGARMEQLGASLAVWVEVARSDEQGAVELVLYVVGGRRDRALVEVARFEHADDPGIDRALALKVLEVLEAVEVKHEEARARLGRLRQSQPSSPGSSSSTQCER